MIEEPLDLGSWMGRPVPNTSEGLAQRRSQILEALPADLLAKSCAGIQRNIVDVPNSNCINDAAISNVNFRN